MIYTLTFHHAHNYGAMLQAYALQQALFKLNINTEIIDYYDTEETIFIKGFDRWTVHYNLSVLLSYSRVKGDTRLNEAKMAEIAERVSM